MSERPHNPAMDANIGVIYPVLDHGFVRVVDYMGDDAAVVQAARVSYGTGTTTTRDDRGAHPVHDAPPGGPPSARPSPELCSRRGRCPVAADPWGVCVVPASGDPGGLLADGLCGARPPAVRWMPRMNGGSGQWVEPATSRGGHPGSIVALPLWWGGELVPEGWDRFVRGGHVSQFPTLAEVLGAAPVAVQAGLASRVVLLDLVDGRVVERAP